VLFISFVRESDFVNEEGLSWRLAVEVAQQWLGHLATPYWWHDSRINKALANYLASMAVEQVCSCLWLTFFPKCVVLVLNAFISL
jgi:hypothetical protein